MGVKYFISMVRATTFSSAQKTQTSSSGVTSQSTQQKQNTEKQVVQESADMSGLEERMDKIIEQNERMIEILEGFGS
ncbi:MAG: hypothetical protein BRC26_02955 [Nanohaloarchaea archaeon QH_8_44_6]|nr:MAG: hypothetical protein BRC26_02955 [Nanohaloarchaea archaeon QH_8_44_6]